MHLERAWPALAAGVLISLAAVLACFSAAGGDVGWRPAPAGPPSPSPRSADDIVPRADGAALLAAFRERARRLDLPLNAPPSPAWWERAAAHDGSPKCDFAPGAGDAHEWQAMRRDAGGGQSPDVFDVAMFNSEMDVLEVRVRELHPVVKRFVLLDCRVTFTGRPKPAGEVAPPGFFANDPRFAPFAAKILHLVVDAFPDTVENITWKREGYLRREALRRAVEHLKPLPGDLFVTADLDEIPRGSALNRLRRCPGWASPAMLTAVGGYYSYDVEGDEWPYPHVWRYMPGIPVPDPGMLRGGRPPSPTRIRMAAWHCSWCLGRVEEFLRKMGDYSHTELDTPRARGVRRLLHSVLTRTDIYDRAVVKFRTSRVRTGPGDMICLR